MASWLVASPAETPRKDTVAEAYGARLRRLAMPAARMAGRANRVGFEWFID
jgi:hypothetical protein